MNNMLKITNDYMVGFDLNNVILYKVKKRGETARNAGQVYFDPIGFFGSIEPLINKMLNDKIANIDAGTLEQLIQAINEFKKDILNSIEKIQLDKKPYMYKYAEVEHE